MAHGSGCSQSFSFSSMHTLLLIIGTNLQSIITRMCLDTHNKSHVVRGTLLIRPSDHFFWFGKPEVLLHLMHFILFQNSFQLAFFTWTWDLLPPRNRGHCDKACNGIVGSHPLRLCNAPSLCPGHSGVAEGLKRWRAKARKNLALRSNYEPGLSLDASVTSLDTSPSFNNVEASFSVELDRSIDGVLVAAQVEDEDSFAGQRTEQKSGSFDFSGTPDFFTLFMGYF
ncbi:unnamed protein product [Thlaspi arvense]|uniref:Uncharacterized protein n=1 Tax=Thlaspi arvense TaxID=13288 RepID=A0AAU9SEU7_THLAR|nr:unnamed protein product [Thlaspi arvense]